MAKTPKLEVLEIDAAGKWGKKGSCYCRIADAGQTMEIWLPPDMLRQMGLKASQLKVGFRVEA